MIFDLLKVLIALHPANDNRRLAEPTWGSTDGVLESAHYPVPEPSSDEEEDD